MKIVTWNCCMKLNSKINELGLIDVIVNVGIGKHREWIHNRGIDKF